MIARPLRFRAVVLSTGLLACGEGDLVLPEGGEPASIEIIQGNEQSGRVGEPLAAPIVARVIDRSERPVSNIPVTLELDAAGGAEGTPDTANTDADGVAAFQVMLGTRIGVVAGEVRVATVRGSRILPAPVQFTAVSSEAVAVTMLAGDGQLAPAGTALPEALVVQIADAFGNPVPGVPVTWTAEGGGSVTEAVVPTDADGRSSVGRVLGGAAGPQQTRADAEGLAGSPVTFLHTATAGAATQLSIVSGDGQTAEVGTLLPGELVVQVLDATQNPVAGVPVAWVVGQGGTVAPETAPTGEDGRSSTRWTLGSAPGEQTVTAIVSGIEPVTFRATAVPGTPPGMRLVTQPSDSAQWGVAFGRQPVVQLVDPAGTDLRQGGVEVTVTVATGGGSVRGRLSRSTDSEGRARFTDLSLEGLPGQYTLAFGADAFSGVVSEAIALTRAATITTIESDTPDPSAPSAAVRVVYRVRSDGGTVAGNVVVRAADGATCRATVSAGACSLTPTQAGGQLLTVSYEGSEQFAPSADTEDHLVEAPPAPPPADPQLVFAVAPPGSAFLDEPFDPQPVIQLQDGAGGDLPTAGIQVTAAVATGGGALIGPTSRTTNSQGRATFSGLGIGGETGPHTVRFSAPGFAPVTSGSIAVSAPPPPPPPAGPSASESRVTVEPSSIAVFSGRAVIRVEVRDAGGTALEAVAVQVSASGSGNSISPASAATNSSGVAEFELTSTAAGTKRITAVAGGVTLDDQPTVTVNRASTQTTIESHEPEPSEEGAEVTVRFSVLSDGGDPTGEVTVSGGGGTCTAPVDAGSCALVLTQTGEVTLTARYGGNAAFDPSEASVQHLVEGSAERSPTAIEITDDEPDPSAPGEEFEVLFQVTSEDGSPTGNVTVTASSGESCSGTVDSGGCAMEIADEGNVILTGRYDGDARFAPSEDTEEHLVE